MTKKDIENELIREWNSNSWYSVSGIAGKIGKTRKTVSNWRELGIKKNGKKIYLEMIKRPCHWYAKGQWVIEFLERINS
jgi:hypothetical protein